MLRDKFIHYFQQWRERQLSRGEHWLTQHLAGRSPREKGMLLAAVVFLFSAGYYVLIWQPLSERIEQQETMLQQLVAMNTRLKSAAPDIIAARKSGTTTPAQVSRVISDSASAHSVVIKRIAERGENIQVWIDPVVFNDLLNWLNALDEKYALRVTQIDVSAAEKPGMVNVQRLELSNPLTGLSFDVARIISLQTTTEYSVTLKEPVFHHVAFVNRHLSKTVKMLKCFDTS